MSNLITYELALERRARLLAEAEATRIAATKRTGSRLRRAAKALAGINLGASAIAANFDRTHAAPFAFA